MTTFAYSGGALNNLVGNTPGANVSNLVTLLNDLKNFLNAPNLDGTNLADIPEGLLALALQQKLGLNDGGQIGRGKTITATQETRTNVAYGKLTTPDEVTVVLPADGLICVAYQALWQESVDATAAAAIFLGGNQLKVQTVGGTVPVVQECNCAGNAGVMTPLATGPTGLRGRAGTSAAAATSDVTTGQVISYDGTTTGEGGPCYIFAAAGTYIVSVQFKSTSGTVTVKERKLWVWTIGF